MRALLLLLVAALAICHVQAAAGPPAAGPSSAPTTPQQQPLQQEPPPAASSSSSSRSPPAAADPRGGAEAEALARYSRIADAAAQLDASFGPAAAAAGGGGPAAAGPVARALLSWIGSSAAAAAAAPPQAAAVASESGGMPPALTAVGGCGELLAGGGPAAAGRYYCGGGGGQPGGGAASSPQQDSGPAAAWRQLLAAGGGSNGGGFRRFPWPNGAPPLNTSTGAEQQQQQQQQQQPDPLLLPDLSRWEAALLLPAAANLSAPADPADLAFLPLAQLAALIRHGKVSSRQLVRAFTARLRALNPRLLGVVLLTERLAAGLAAAADAELAAGRYRGVLHGIPYGLKDLYAAPGYPTSWGVPGNQQVRARAAASSGAAALIPVSPCMLGANWQQPTSWLGNAACSRMQALNSSSSWVFQRLTASGAILLAKLATGALAWGDEWCVRDEWVDGGPQLAGWLAGRRLSPLRHARARHLQPTDDRQSICNGSLPAVRTGPLRRQMHSGARAPVRSNRQARLACWPPMHARMPQARRPDPQPLEQNWRQLRLLGRLSSDGGGRWARGVFVSGQGQVKLAWGAARRVWGVASTSAALPCCLLG
jgi:hypothetical protein